MTQQNNVNVVNVSTSHSAASSQAAIGLRFFTQDGQFNFQPRGREMAKLTDAVAATKIAVMACKGIQGYKLEDSSGSGCTVYNGDGRQVGFLNGNFDEGFSISRVEEFLDAVRETGVLIKEQTLEDQLAEVAEIDLDDMLA